MKNLMISLGIALAVTLATPSAKAQQFSPNADKGVSSNKDVAIAVNDVAVKAIVDAQANPISNNPKISAETCINSYIKGKGWTIRPYAPDPKKPDNMRIIKVGTHKYKIEDPANKDDFFIIRDRAVRNAILRARAEIAEYIRTEISAKDELYIPGSPIQIVFNPQLKEIESKLEEQKKKVQELLSQLNIAVDEVANGVTFLDRFNSFLDAAIKKLDESYSKEKIEGEKKAKLEDIKTQYEKAKQEQAELEKKAIGCKASVSENSKTYIEMYAAMPIFGSTLLAQAESWDSASKFYEVSVCLVWSSKLHAAARAMLLNEKDIAIEEKSNQSLDSWLETQDLGAIAGPRQFLDNNGERWFLGVASRNTDLASANQDMKNKKAAQMLAKVSLVYSLFSDIQTASVYQDEVQTAKMNGTEITKAIDSIDEKISTALKDMQISGATEVFSKKAVNPITNKEMHVSVYGISTEAAKMALGAEKQNYATMVEFIKKQAEQIFFKKTLDKRVDAAKNDSASIENGKKAANAAIDGELEKRKPTKQDSEVKEKTSQNLDPNAEKTTNPPKKESKSGVFMGDKNVEDNF